MAAFHSLRRKLYLWLTTSQRDKLHRRDYLSSKALAWSQRDRVQRVNDVFHQAGQRGKLHTYESATLEFKENAWGFLILPAVFCGALLLFITSYRSGERKKQREERRQLLEDRAVATREKTEEAAKLLEASRAEVPATLAELRVSEDERRLVTQLEENLQFLARKTATAPPPL